MISHECDFGQPKFKRVGFCKERECTEVRVGTKRGKWRKLTVDEQITVTAHQMEAIAIAQGMQIIHGRDRGLKRAREVLGYGT